LSCPEVIAYCLLYERRHHVKTIKQQAQVI
jgi:hypothetical protein